MAKIFRYLQVSRLGVTRTRDSLARLMPQLNIHLAHVCRCSAGQESRLVLILFHSGSRVRKSRSRRVQRHVRDFNREVSVLHGLFAPPLRDCIKGLAVFSSSVSYLCPVFFGRSAYFCPPSRLLLYSAALKTQQTLPFSRLFNDGAIKLAPALIPARLPAASSGRRVITSYRKAVSCTD